jgi:hypothetical protein
MLWQHWLHAYLWPGPYNYLHIHTHTHISNVHTHTHFSYTHAHKHTDNFHTHTQTHKYFSHWQILFTHTHTHTHTHKRTFQTNTNTIIYKLTLLKGFQTRTHSFLHTFRVHTFPTSTFSISARTKKLMLILKLGFQWSTVPCVCPRAHCGTREY